MLVALALIELGMKYEDAVELIREYVAISIHIVAVTGILLLKNCLCPV